jgi:hypothetical protein
MSDSYWRRSVAISWVEQLPIRIHNDFCRVPRGTLTNRWSRDALVLAGELPDLVICATAGAELSNV